MALRLLFITFALYFSQGLAADSPLQKSPISFFGYDWWIVLGQTEDSSTLNDLTIHVNNVITSDDGPQDMMSWEFQGNSNSYVRVENPQNGPLSFDESFTIGTYMYQDYITNGPIVEWSGRTYDNFGTHFWIWEELLFMNLMPTWGHPTSMHWHTEVPEGGWHFVGASYNHLTGNLTMWVDTADKSQEIHVGQQKPTCIGDVFIGNRPKNRRFNPLKAKLAGLTIINGPIDRAQIKEFKCNIVAFVANESPQVSYDEWLPHTDDFFTKCFFVPDELPLYIDGLPTAKPKTYDCSAIQTNPHQYFSTNWWNILGQDENNPTLNGLSLDIVGVGTTSDGPNGIPSWNFLGSPNSYIRIPNPVGGHLDLRDSFTIGTFIYQSDRRNGAILEWRGSQRMPFGTHFWIWSNELFVNLVGIRRQYNFKTIPRKSWHFVGMSFSKERGRIIMWLDDASDLHTRYVGSSRQGATSAFGDVYIGNRAANHNFSPFKGKLAGLTVLDGDIEPSEIEDFKCKILSNVALNRAVPTTTAFQAPKLLNNKWWLLLGSGERSDTLNGLELQVHGVKKSDTGPQGLTAWEFAGARNSYIKINNPQHGPLNFNASFTIGTFIYQDVIENGPIIEWRGSGVQQKGWGTHLWIWQQLFFLNLAPRFGGRNEHFHTAVHPGAWRFVGITFNHETGNLTMWVDGDIYVVAIGRRRPDCRGNVYIGNRGSARYFNPFKGKLAGLTVLDGAIDMRKIKQFRCLIVAIALKGSYPDNWDPSTTYSFKSCQFEPLPRDPNKPMTDNGIGTCNASSTDSDHYFGFKWWNILGPNQNNRHLNGLTLDVTGVDITSDGPNGMSAWVFNGTATSYIRIPNPPGGPLEFKSSFTIGTFFYQRGISDELGTSPIVEWRGDAGATLGFGAHFWIFRRRPTVNMSFAVFPRAVPVDGSWHFIGASFNLATGTLVMWIDDTTHIGVYDLNNDTLPRKGDVYIGNRGSNHSFMPFRGKLAGLTLLEGAISAAQIEEFKCKILGTATGSE